MRIKSLHLENFRGFEQLNIEFPDNSNVVVFIGENGSGKSSLIDAIKVNLGYYLYSTFEYNADLMKFLTIEDVKLGQEGCLIKIFMRLDNNEGIYIQNVLNYPNQSNTIAGASFNYVRMIKEVGNGNVPVIICYGRRKYAESTGNFPQYKHKQFLANYNSLNAPILNFIDFLNWFKLESNREEKQKIATKNLEFTSIDLDIIKKTIPCFLENLGENTFSNFRMERIELPPQHLYDVNFIEKFYIDKNGTKLDFLENLSEGEKIIIQLAIDITRRLLLANPSLANPLEGTGIVLIDEIELHLHPKWQRNIIPALTKTFPNVQFIITTHSPQVLSYVPNGSAFSIENGNVYPVNTYGRDNEWILETIMNDIARPKEIQEKLDKLFNLIRDNEIDTAKQLRKEIAVIIGEDEAELLKADILIQRKTKNSLHETHQ